MANHGKRRGNAPKDEGTAPSDDGTDGEGQEDATSSDADFDGDGPPPGYDVQVSREKGEGWMVKAEGATCQGRLIGRFTYQGEDGERAFYQFKISKPVLCVVGKGAEATEETLAKGAIVNVDESVALTDLAPRCGDGGIYDVWLQYGKQQAGKTRKRKGFWPMRVKLRVVKDPPRHQNPKPVRRERDDDGGLPF